MENQNPRIFFFFSNARILVLWKTGTGEFSFCEKPELENFVFFLSENSPIVENQNPRIFFLFFLSENSRFVEKQNWRIFFFFFYPRILLLWKTRIQEIFFFYARILVLLKTRIGEFFFYPRILLLWKTRIREFFFFFIREFSFFGKRELVNSRFEKNQNWRIFFFFIREFSYCGKLESEYFFVFLSENSRVVENGNGRILVLWKTRIGEFFFFFYPRILVLWKTGTGEFSFSEKRELEKKNFFSENSGFVETEHPRFVENGNWRILVLWKTGIGNKNFFFHPRILVLWKWRIFVW